MTRAQSTEVRSLNENSKPCSSLVTLLNGNHPVGTLMSNSNDVGPWSGWVTKKKICMFVCDEVIRKKCIISFKHNFSWWNSCRCRCNMMSAIRSRLWYFFFSWPAANSACKCWWFSKFTVFTSSIPTSHAWHTLLGGVRCFCTPGTGFQSFAELVNWSQKGGEYTWRWMEEISRLRWGQSYPP